MVQKRPHTNLCRLSSGDYATYEGLSSWAYDFAAGLGNVEYSITVRSLPHMLPTMLTGKAYPGICLHDQNCWGNPRGQVSDGLHCCLPD
jgi:hypothetical protein